MIRIHPGESRKGAPQYVDHMSYNMHILHNL